MKTSSFLWLHIISINKYFNLHNTCCGCAFPKFICGNSNLQCDAIRNGAIEKWLGHKAEPLMNGISVLTRDPRKLPHHLPPREDAVRRWPSPNQEVGPHQNPIMLQPPDLSETTVAVKPPGLWYFVIGAHVDWDNAMIYSNSPPSRSQMIPQRTAFYIR